MRNDRRVYPDKLRLGLLPVGHKAVAEHLACTGHTGQALGDHAAGAAFGGGNGQAVRPQRMHHRFFQPGDILIIHRIAQQIIELFGVGAAHGLRLGVILRPGGDADLALAGLAVDGSGGVRVFQQRTHPVFQIALAAQHPQRQAVHGTALPRQQQRAHTFLPHGLHLVGHAGHQHGTVAVLLEPCTRRGAVVVDYLMPMHWHHGLLAVVGGGLAPGAGKEVHDLLPLVGVKGKGITKAGSHSLLGQVVRRGTQPAGEHQQVAPLLCLVDKIRQTAMVIADSALPPDGDAQCSQLPAEVLGIGVKNVAEQQLGTDTDDLCCHGQINPRILPDR